MRQVGQAGPPDWRSRVASGSSYSKGFCSDWAPMNGREVGVLPVHQRHEPVLRQFRLAAVADRDLGRALHVGRRRRPVGNVWVGSPSTAPPDSMPRIREHQPYILKDPVMLTAMA